jgi:hypothetical protein
MTSYRTMAWNKERYKAPIPACRMSAYDSRMSAINSFYTEYTTMNDQVSGYDPSIFLGATLTQANTRRPPIPGGTVLRGTLGKPATRQTTGTKETNQGVVYTWVDIPVELDLTQKPDVQQHVGQDKVVLTHSFRLDILPPPAKGLDMSPGKNNGLRQLREAVDMNQDGAPFQMYAVEGRTILAAIKNDPYQGEVYDKIASIAHV